ncbi:hypothetical protein UFOVP1008_3 [uncultured Caudovirales phage]|uniref:Terminase-like family n=1 Tax=uncultured Caudovirales phage TaxID=2100421 RepID=A0A6J5S2J2_9CAUD|nr:hypothetical protein UFOVP498_11 [uncultured Caudovirales phage]CAB4177512.1 hypothetical protein UFOVP1008_3 [uncultured Caudovirales phage]CAB4187462.1 hypothetical protein UFOVP1160_43 [uncultured Caudovirales phage]CAB4199665.1 hypothetical protein UFOVP1352_7 [uncultured Caudovirales phage]
MQTGRAKLTRSRLVAPDGAVHVSYAPQGATLLRMHQSKAHVRIIVGPLGSGKTQSVIAEVLAQMDSQAPDQNGVRRSRWAAVRNSYPDLQTTTIADWRRWTDGMGVGRLVMSTPPTWSCKYMKSDGTTVEAEMMFLAFDLADDQRKARGLQLTGLWLNEVKELSHTNVSQLMARVGRYPEQAVQGAKYGVLGDTNAPDRDHWLARFAIDTVPDNWEFFIQPGAMIRVGGAWEPNPLAENLTNLPTDYYRNAIAGRAESWVRSNIGNEFVFHADGRPVHPGFNESLHVAKVGPFPGIPLVVGIDFGRTPAATVWQRQPNGSWHALAEMCTVNTSARTFGRLLRRFLSERYPGYALSIWGDPAGSAQAQTEDQTPFDMLLAEGLEALPAPSNDFEKRCEAIDGLLREIIDGRPALLVDPSCSTLIRGLAGAYQFKRVKVSGEDRFHDRPVKDSTSHVVESAQYALLGAGEGQPAFSSEWATENSELVDAGWAPEARYFE